MKTKHVTMSMAALACMAAFGSTSFGYSTKKIGGGLGRGKGTYITDGNDMGMGGNGDKTQSLAGVIESTGTNKTGADDGTDHTTGDTRGHLDTGGADYLAKT